MSSLMFGGISNEKYTVRMPWLGQVKVWSGSALLIEGLSS